MYGLPTDNAPYDMQLFLQQYIIGMIAVIDQNNDDTEVYGKTPISANTLDIEWQLLWIIVSLIAGCHAILLVVFTTISSRVLIPHDNPLALAKLLARKYCSNYSIPFDFL
jgi:hypothetical protein